MISYCLTMIGDHIQLCKRYTDHKIYITLIALKLTSLFVNILYKMLYHTHSHRERGEMEIDTETLFFIFSFLALFVAVSKISYF